MLLLAPCAAAQGEAPRAAILWYRSSEGCPDGASFVASLGERAPLVRLAEAGDRVDFVVNLALSEDGARGRLERESGRGTVAIREVEDASCERVAQVVALNLSLALDPAGRGLHDDEEPTTSGEPEASEPDQTFSATKNSLARESEASQKASGKPPAVAETADPAPPASDAPLDTAEGAKTTTDSTPSSRWRVGLQGGVQGGVTPGLLGRGALFVEARGLVPSLPNLTLRASGGGAAGSAHTDLGAIQQTLWAGRFDVCPLSFGTENLRLSPCAAVEVGQIRATGPLSASAFWGAAGPSARGIWAFTPAFAVEAEVDANIPLSKYEILAGQTVLYRTAPVGISALLGASFAF